MHESQYKLWLRLKSIKGLGANQIKKLLKYFPSVEEIFRAGKAKLSELQFLNNKVIYQLCHKVETDFVKKQILLIDKYNVNLLNFEEEEYPDLLKFIYSPPIILYVNGKINPEDNNAFAIVGTRKASSYGKTQATRLSMGLAKSGFTIVSGLAYGIDAAAHRGALEAGGRTIAVFGTGLDTIYPHVHKRLATNILSSGALISEFPLQSKIEKWNFPTRNRIISGMCKGVLVVEGKKTSGSLLTAKEGLRQNRDIFAIPGNINREESVGPNYLIKLGAKIVTCVDDILEDYKIKLINESEKKNSKLKPSVKMTKQERKIYKILRDNKRKLLFDKLVTKSTYGVSKLSSILLSMEIKGIVERQAQNYYQLI